MRNLNLPNAMIAAIAAKEKTQFRIPARVASTGKENGFVTPFNSWTPRSPAEHLSYAPYKVGERVALRRSPHVIKIATVRLQQLQDISPEDAIAEGFTTDRCTLTFTAAAGRSRMKFGRYLEDAEGNDLQTEWCIDCVTKAAREKKAVIRGYDDYPECDYLPFCEACGILLCHMLTDYGLTEELFSVPPSPACGYDALILRNIIDMQGFYLTPEQLGRLAQIAYATWWNRYHRSAPWLPWEKNPWVWAYTFTVLE